VEFILDQIHRFPGQITLVTIGPVTNVGGVVDKDPSPAEASGDDGWMGLSERLRGRQV
jgi:inosine-uridine nucleoside N-ribohydrolase